jgi:hypothetical protein
MFRKNPSKLCGAIQEFEQGRFLPVCVSYTSRHPALLRRAGAGLFARPAAQRATSIRWMRRASLPSHVILANRSGADPLVRGRPPGRPFRGLHTLTKADEGVGRGPGGPPHSDWQDLGVTED